MIEDCLAISINLAKSNNKKPVMQIKAKISLFFLLLLFSSCQKSADGIFPQIVFLSPNEGHVVESDSILLRVHVSDNLNLASIRIGVLDENKISVLTPLYIAPKTKDTIIEKVLFGLASLNSGKYFLHVQAYDGINVKNQYREINYFQDESEEINVLLVQSNDGQSQIWKMNSTDGYIQPMMQLDYEIADLDFLIETQKLYLITKFPSELQAWNLIENEPLWSFSSSFPHKTFTALSAKNNHLLIAEKAGRIWKIQANTGEVVHSTPIQIDTFAYRINRSEDYIFAAQKLTNNRHLLGIFYETTGQLFRNELLSGEVIGSFVMNARKILFILKHPNGFAVEIYDIQNQSFATVFESELHQPVFSVLTKYGQLFLASDFKLFHCDYVINDMVEIYNSPTRMILSFEPEQQVFYIASDFELLKMKTDGTILDQFNLTEDIDMIRFSYPSE